MKTYKNTDFRKYIISYVCILLLPLSVFLIFTSFYYVGFYRDQIIYQNQVELERAASDFDSQVLRMHVIAKQVGLDHSVKQLAALNSVENIRLCCDILKNYMVTHDFISDIAFYSGKYPDMIFTQEGTYNTDYFCHYLYDGQDVPISERLSRTPFRMWMPADNIYWPLSVRRPSHLEYAVEVPGISDSYVIFQISDQYMNNTLNTANACTSVYGIRREPLYLSSEEPDPEEYAIIQKNEDPQKVYELQNGNFLLVTRSAHTDFIFARQLSRDVMLSPLHHFQKIFLLLFVALTLACGVLVYVFATVRYKPIRQLESLTSTLTLDVPEELHGAERAEFVISRLNERYETLSRMWRREKLFYYLIHGRPLPPDYESILKDQNAVFSSEHFRTVLIFCDAGTPGQEDTDVLRATAEILSEPYRTAGIEYLENNCWLFLVGYDEQNDEEFCDRLRAAAESFGAGCRIVAGGEVDSLSEVHLSYAQAMTASRLGDGENPVSVYIASAGQKVNFVYPKIELESLYKAITNRNLQKAQLISEMLLDTVRSNSKNELISYSLSAGIVTALIGGLEEISPDRTDYYSEFADVSDRDSCIRAAEQLTEYLEDVIGNSEETEKQNNLVSEAIDFVCRNADNAELSVNYLADCFEISVSNMSHQFKSVTGRNLSDFITEKKMEYAKTLLRTTKISIGDIGIQLGYTQASSFTRKFKQYEHCTPNEYRGSLQENSGE